MSSSTSTTTTNTPTSSSVKTLTIPLPDDFHHHFRDGAKTALIASHAARRFGRCIAMPNLVPPVTTAAMAKEYRDHILQSQSVVDELSFRFDPLMTLYLTDHTTPEEIRRASVGKLCTAAKYYPAGATTNSDSGVTDVTKIYDTLKEMEAVGMILCIHSEVTGATIDVFDREEVFIERVMKPLIQDFPSLKIVMEHISTDAAVEFVTKCGPNVGATITAHHLLYNRNALLGNGGIRPHFFCLPILKRETHRVALLGAATSPSPKFFAGTDSAPHATGAKESCCGCAGVYTAHAAVELYAEAFESVGALDVLGDFLGNRGRQFYGLDPPTEAMVLARIPWTVPDVYDFGNGTTVTPLRAGETVQWSIVERIPIEKMTTATTTTTTDDDGSKTVLVVEPLNKAS